MLISLDQDVLERYPNAAIGYLVAKVSVCKNDPIVENMKQDLGLFLKEHNLNATTYVTHPNIALWRKIYQEDFCVSPKTYRSSVEALLRRVVTGKGIWNISNVVDLYNCCSVRSLLPMGAYDLDKVSGNITIRHGREGETFVGLGERLSVEVKPNHIVYADNEDIICWLWNHKDAEKTCIDEHSQRIVVFMDAFDHIQVEDALEELGHNLKQIGCAVHEIGILDNKTPQVSLNMCVSH